MEKEAGHLLELANNGLPYLKDEVQDLSNRVAALVCGVKLTLLYVRRSLTRDYKI
jgi:hypothetical protein